MSDVLLVLDEIEDTVEQKFPPKTGFGGYEFGITGYPSQVIPVAPFQALFKNIPPGDYEGSFQAVDALGNLLGTAVTIPVNSPEPDVVIRVPISGKALVSTVSTSL